MSVDCSDGEPVDAYTERVRRAKKEWHCHACSGPIRRGDLYHRTALLFEGEWYITRRCARCEAMYRFLSPLVSRLGGGEERCDESLDCGHQWKDNFEGEPPLAVQALAFLTPAEAQVLISKRPRFTRHEALDDGKVAWFAGPVESEDARITRLLRTILGDRMPLPTEQFVAVEREDRWENE